MGILLRNDPLPIMLSGMVDSDSAVGQVVVCSADDAVVEGGKWKLQPVLKK